MSVCVKERLCLSVIACVCECVCECLVGTCECDSSVSFRMVVSACVSVYVTVFLLCA